jgi:guanylate kinase
LSNGKLVILSGPSGVGKDTVIDAWRDRNSRVARVVAYTTRPPRPHEVDGADYHFVSVADFRRKAEAGDFLEFKEVHGNYYATPKTDMEGMLRQGLIAVLKIDVQGAISVMRIRPDALTVFLLPPSREELMTRITGRGTDDPEAVQRRMRNAEEEIALSDRYRYPIINRDVEGVVDELEGIVNG